MKKFTGAATISCAVIALALTACAPQSNENGAASADDAKETPITVAWSADSECDACLSCHYGAREELVAATVDVAVVDSKGTAVNPHDVTPSEQHDTIRCADCHGMHDAEKLADKADAECASCHHADVFECYTCHD